MRSTRTAGGPCRPRRTNCREMYAWNFPGYRDTTVRQRENSVGKIVYVLYVRPTWKVRMLSLICTYSGRLGAFV